MGNHGLSDIGLKLPFSFAGNQSYLSSIPNHPLEAALVINPFRALNCRANPNVKNVGNAKIGANHFDLSIGFSASNIVNLII